MVGVSHSDGAVRLWETGRGGNCIREMEGQHRGAATGIDFSHNGHSVFATVGADGWVRYIDIRVGEKSGRVLRSTETRVPLTCLSFHNEGHVLAVGASDGTIRLIDLRTPSQVGPPKVAYAGPSPPHGGVRDVAFQRPSPCISISSSSSSSCSSNGATSPAGLGVTESWGSSPVNRTMRPGVRPAWEAEMAREGADAPPAARLGRAKRRPGDGVEVGEKGPSGYGDDAANAPPSMVEGQPRRRRPSGKGSRADSAPLPPTSSGGSGGSDGSVNRAAASRRAGRSNGHDSVAAAAIGQRHRAAASTTARRSSEQQRTAREEGVDKDVRRRRREKSAGEEVGTSIQRVGYRESTVGRSANASREHRLPPSPEHHVVPEHADKPDQHGQKCGGVCDDRGVAADEEDRWSLSHPSLRSSTSGRNIPERDRQQPPSPPDRQPSEISGSLPTSTPLHVEPSPHSLRRLQQQQERSNGHESVTLSMLQQVHSARVGVNGGGRHRDAHPDGLSLSRPSLRSSNSGSNKYSPPSPPDRRRSEADVPLSTSLSIQGEPSSPPSRRRRQQQQPNSGHDSTAAGIDRGGRGHGSHHEGLNLCRPALRSSASGRNASGSDRQQPPSPPGRRRSETDGSLPTPTSFQEEPSPHHRRRRQLQQEQPSNQHGSVTLSKLQEGQGARIGKDQGGRRHKAFDDGGDLSRPSVRSTTSGKSNQPPPSPSDRRQSDAKGPLPTSSSLHAERSFPSGRRQQQQQQHQQPNKHASVTLSTPQTRQIAGAGVDRGGHRHEAQTDDLGLSRPSLQSPPTYVKNSQQPPSPPVRRRSETNSSLQMPPSLDVERSSRRRRQQELEQQANHGYESVLLSPPHLGHSTRAVVDRGLNDSFFPLNDDEGSGVSGGGAGGAKRLTSPGHSQTIKVGPSASFAPSPTRSASGEQAGDGAEVKEKSGAAPTRDTGGTGARSSGLDRAMLEQVLSSQGAMMDQVLSSQRTMIEDVLSSQISILRKELRQEFRNVHIDMLRQFQSHQDEQALAMAGIEERLGCLIAENMALRAENNRLRSVY